MVEHFANNASSTLTSGIDASTTSITLVDASKFSATGTFRIVIESEIMLVTARLTNTLTVVRGAESTIATSHNSGATATEIMTAGGVQQFRSDNIQVDTYANLPTVGTAGRLYRTSDGNISFIDNGTTWLPFGPTVPLIQPPVASNFTISQTGTNNTIVDDSGGLFLTAIQRIASTDGSVIGLPNPGGTGAAYTLTAGIIHIPGGKNGTAGFFNYHITGIGLYNSSTTQYRSMFVYTTGSGDYRFQLRGGTGLTSAGTFVFDVGGYSTTGGPMTWFRVQDDGTTNRTWSLSNDGRHFVPITVEARTTTFTTQPNNIGLYISAEGADARMNVLSFSLTSP